MVSSSVVFSPPLFALLWASWGLFLQSLPAICIVYRDSGRHREETAHEQAHICWAPRITMAWADPEPRTVRHWYIAESRFKVWYICTARNVGIRLRAYLIIHSVCQERLEGERQKREGEVIDHSSLTAIACIHLCQTRTSSPFYPPPSRLCLLAS